MDCLLLILQSFDWLTAFHLELLQAILFVAGLYHTEIESKCLWFFCSTQTEAVICQGEYSVRFYCYQYSVCHVTWSPRAHIPVPCHITPFSFIFETSHLHFEKMGNVLSAKETVSYVKGQLTTIEAHYSYW